MRCPNYTTCKLLTTEKVVTDAETKNEYLVNYCEGGQEKWTNCMRYKVFQELGFCPDFVFPDSYWEIRGILNKLEDDIFTL